MTRHPAFDNEPINWGDEPPEPPPPPSARRSIRLGFAAVYDYMGSSIATSVLLFAILSVPLSVLYAAVGRLMLPASRLEGFALVIFVLALGPLLSPLVAGVYVLANNMRKHDDPHLFDLLRGARLYAGRALALGYLQTWVTAFLATYALMLLARPESAMKIAGILVAYVALFFAMMATYHWPLLVEQQAGVKTVLYRGFLLAAANPFYTLAVTLFVLFLVVAPVAVFFAHAVGPIVLVPVSMAWGILLPAVQLLATTEILRKYDSA